MNQKSPNQPDAIDLKILNILQNDASISQRALAEAVHISPATALRRIKHLKQQGWIEREVAILSPTALGQFIQVIAEITLDVQDYESLELFESHIIRVQEVQQCYRVSAGPDFIVVLTVKNMQHYQDLARDVFSSNHHVRNVRAFFATKRCKFTTELPIE